MVVARAGENVCYEEVGRESSAAAVLGGADSHDWRSA